MIAPQDIVFAASCLVTMGFILASWALERRYVPLKRREPERGLALYGYYRVSIVARVIGSCWYHRVLWLGVINTGLLLLWGMRYEERRKTFALERPRHTLVFPIGGLTTVLSIAVAALPFGCRIGELIVAFVFAYVWSGATFAVYSLENRIPRPHRERGLVVMVGVNIFMQTCIAPFLIEPWSVVIMSVAQLIVSARMLAPDIVRALAGTDTTDFYRAVYESGAPIYSAREVLQTPLSESFLIYCEKERSDAVRVYRAAVDRGGAAAVEGVLAELEPCWSGFVAHSGVTSPTRRLHDLDGSSSEEGDSSDATPPVRRFFNLDGSSEEGSSGDDEEEIQYVNLSEMG